MDFLQTLHGEIRWLVAIVAIIAIIKFAYGWLAKKEYRRLDRLLMTAFAVLVDINVLLGLTLFFFLPGGFPGYRLEHAVTMVIAALVAHSNSMWRNSENDSLIFRNNFLAVIASLAIIFVGVMRLRGGWIF